MRPIQLLMPTNTTAQDGEWGKRRRWQLWCTPRYWFRRLLKLRAEPHEIALGSSIGVFVAMTPTIGFQMVIAGVLATVFRVSRPAAVLPVWLSNPVTLGPIFAVTYWVGSLVWPWRLFHADVISGEELVDHGLLMYGADALLMMAVGGVIVGLICGAATYPVVKWGAVRYQMRRQRLRLRLAAIAARP